MKTEAAEIISDYVGEIYEDYSGRGMFGSTTTAITCDSEEQFNEGIAEIMENEDSENISIVAKAVRSLRKDSLGIGMIFY